MPRAVRSREKPADAAREAVFKALADPTRRRILHLLGEREMRAGDLAARFDVSRPAVSRHLRVLLDAGLLQARRSGRERHYSIVPGPLRDAAAQLQELEAFWGERMRGLGEHLEGQ